MEKEQNNAKISRKKKKIIMTRAEKNAPETRKTTETMKKNNIGFWKK